MSENKVNTLLNGARNDLKIAVDDLFNVIDIIYDDVELLKIKTSKNKPESLNFPEEIFG